MINIITQEFVRELEAERTATRKCLERMKEDLFEYKPHEKSMKMGYLAQVVAEIPKWISATVRTGEVNFATWEKYTVTTVEDLVKFYDANIVLAIEALNAATDEDLEGPFVLKAGDQELMKDSKKNSVSSSINHLVHHRGQLTVYMRLNDIAVPSIYGPSADDKTF